MSHPDAARLGPPPRDVPWTLRARLRLGGLSFVGWLVLAFTSPFFWGFAMNCEAVSWFTFAGAVESGAGRVTHSEKTGASEGGGKGRKGTPIYANHYVYTVEGREYAGRSYATGTALGPGGAVTVEYLVSDPGTSRIRGMRRYLFGAGAAFTILFPLIAVGILVSGARSGGKAVRLLADGLLADARLKQKRATSTRVNKQTVYALTFEFTGTDGRPYEVTHKTHRTAELEDEATEQVLYDPAEPSRALPIDALPKCFAIDEDGRLRALRPFLAPLWFLVPALTLGGNLAWLLISSRR